MKRAIVGVMALFFISGCGEGLPTGEPALREAMGAMSSGKTVSETGAALASEMAEFTVDMTSGFAGEELASQWDGARIADKAAAAIKIHEDKLDKAFYAALAKGVPEEVTSQLVADIRDPKKLAALQCAYRPDGMRFELGTCDMDAMGDPAKWGPRYITLKQALDKTANDPVVLGVIGSAACDVSDEFLNAARKANPDLTVGDIKITRGDKSYDCATFRTMATPAAKS